MKQWQVWGAGVSSLKLAEVAKPEPQPGEVLVRVRAVSLNYRDRLLIDNNGYEAYGLPFTPGSDLSGEVEAVGAGVTRFEAGDRVINNFNADWLDGPPPRVNGVVPSFGGPLAGVLSQYVAVPDRQLVAAPESLSHAQASTLPCCGLTAWTSLIELGGLQPGQTVVVQGTGGISIFALQWAVAVGARVIVTSSSDEKLARAMRLGASAVVNRASRPNWADAVHEITEGRGADHIVEVAGGANLGRSILALAPGGRVSLIGVIDGFDSTFPSVPAILAHATIQAVYVGHRRGLENMVRAIDRIKLKPEIANEFDLSELPAALEAFGIGAFGKVVLNL